MASEHQIAANRRNAAKSTGPRSKNGKRRASGNSFRHGLASRAILTEGAAEQIEELTRAIAAGHDSVLVHEWANTAASAMLDLARVRQMKGVLMADILGRRSTETPEVKQQDNIWKELNQLPEIAYVKKSRTIWGILYRSLLRTFADAHRMRLTPLEQLRTLDRYERRFSARRDRAIRKIVQYTRGEE